jgi:choline dehydrogenase-like flavoprotein
MLNSASAKHPKGLSNQSGALGHYLMDHGKVIHTGIFVDNTDSYYRGNRPNGLYIPRFRNVGGQDDDADFVRGYGYQAHTIRGDWQMRFNQRGFGAGYKDALIRPDPIWIWGMASFMECLPREDNRVYLEAQKKDRFGVPLLATEFTWSENERRLADDTGVQAAKLLRAAGAVFFDTGDRNSLDEGGGATHEMGTARMGDDPALSVLNKHNQAHEVDNLFVTDGAFMTSASCVNPSLTYMAFTARACNYAVEQLKAGQIGI